MAGEPAMGEPMGAMINVGILAEDADSREGLGRGGNRGSGHCGGRCCC